MCSCFWKLLAASSKSKPELTTYFDKMMTQNFIFTFDYMFETIKLTSKGVEMVNCTICIKFNKILKIFLYFNLIQKTVVTLLYEICKNVSTLSSNQNIMNIVMSNLEKNMKNTLFLETKEGKLIIADLYTTNQQLFLVIF